MAGDPDDPRFKRDVYELVLENLTGALRMCLTTCDYLDPPPWNHPRVGHNLPEMLRIALERIAEEQGVDRLVEHRPGSWEAELVRRFVGAPTI